MTLVLRAVAFAIAAAAVLDPAFHVERLRPLALELVAGPGEWARSARDELLSALGGDVTIAPSGRGDAVVTIDAPADAGSVRGVSVSAITVGSAPNVRLIAAWSPAAVLPGQEGTIAVDAEVRNLAGSSSVLTATHNGVEIGRTERRWSGAIRQRAAVPFVALEAGTIAIRIDALPLPIEARRDDNAIDAIASATERRLRVAFVEPRPSWSAGFVRRALESDPAFDVASIVRASRGIDVRSGPVPSAIRPRDLEPFDVVVAGAPEELRRDELDALRTFASERGGTVVLLPDRRPSGPYAAWLPNARFDEVLLESPVALRLGGTGAEPRTPPSMPRASELIVPRTPGPAARVLASLPDGRAVIVAWPAGDGSIVLSGALDAWRFRAAGGDGFTDFWRAAIARAAVAAPPPVRVALDPPVAARGSAVRVVARVRPTAFERGADGSIGVPQVRGVAVATLGRSTMTESIRLWPTAETGVFEGRFVPTAGGRQAVHAVVGREQDFAPVVLSESARRSSDEDAAIVAAATGGVVSAVSDLAPLVRHLRAVRRGRVAATVHPMRSAWWVLPFTAALCAEWALRRRRGQR